MLMDHGWPLALFAVKAILKSVRFRRAKTKGGESAGFIDIAVHY